MRNMVHGTSEIDADDDNQSEVIALQIDPDLKVKSTRTLQRNRKSVYVKIPKCCT